jgi:serine/threonine protein kinase
MFTLQSSFKAGTLAYMAPESTSSTNPWTVDVYSFGLLLWALFPTSDRSVMHKEGDFAFLRRMATGERPPIPPECKEFDEEYAALIEECWSQDSARRPPFSNIIKRLGFILEDCGLKRETTQLPPTLLCEGKGKEKGAAI